MNEQVTPDSETHTRPQAAPSLTWAIKATFISYVIDSGGTVETEGTVQNEHGFTFAGSDIDDAYTGVVRFSAHGGALAVVIADPQIRRSGDLIDITVAIEGDERIVLAVLEDDETTGPGIYSARLTKEGSTLFDGIYPTGLQLDPVRVIERRSTAEIAIVGSGPAGCYTAQALRKLLPEARIVIFDRMPVPYGLVRYGIAADHQGTKNVARQFDRLFERDGIGFVGNASIGEVMSWDQFRECFHATVIATGMPVDRLLDVPGGRLPGVYGSGAFSSHLNGHPGFAREDFRPGPDVVIVGAGNVAVDIVRLLAKPLHALADSDIHPDHASSTLAGQVERITLLSRSRLADVRCDAAMVRELGQLDGVRISVVGATDCSEDASSAARALLELDDVNGDTSPRVQITFRFGSNPLEVLGEKRVVAVRSHEGTGVVETPATSVISAIGFEAAGPLPQGPDVFPTGWAHIGPRGALPEARLDARRAASAVANFLTGDSQTSQRPGMGAVLPFLSAPTDFHGWKRIDAAETAAAAPDRVRQKLLDIDDLLAVARSTTDRKDPRR